MRQGFPYWVLGFIGGLILIVIVARSPLAPSSEQLQAQFAPRPGEGASVDLPPIPSLSELPPELQNVQATAIALLGGGSQIPALTPTARHNTLAVEITSLSRSAAGLRIRGSITNTGQQPRSISTTDLRFHDNGGQVYAASGGSATLAPGESAPIDLTVPVPAGSGLTLSLDLPPDPPLELVLLAQS